MQTRRYTVTVQGRLGTRFAHTFPGATITPGPGDTRLLTEPFDQAQLHGLLNRIRDFGINILAVEETSPHSATTAAPLDHGFTS